jgi:hypothetical protein
MEFIHARPDIVRSANQRWLLDHWNGLRDSNPLPNWRGLQQGFAPLSADLSLIDVIGPDGAARFQIRFHGPRVAALYGRTNCVGKFLDEILIGAYSKTALSTYHQAVATRLPVYTVADMRDGAGRIVLYERLLLPFSDDGVSVDRILASLETVSPEGDFDSHGLMKAPPKAPAFALCATIET